MSAISVQAMLPSAVTASAGPAATPEPDDGFATLLGQFADPPKGAEPKPEDAPDASALALMQSLEAAMAGLAAFAAPTAGKSEASPQPGADKAAAALSEAAGALSASAFDATGRTPLKALLEADPSLGLRDFQVKTYLAAAGAAPAKSGGATLGPESAWSPFEAAKIASALGAAADDAKLAAAPKAPPDATGTATIAKPSQPPTPIPATGPSSTAAAPGPTSAAPADLAPIPAVVDPAPSPPTEPPAALAVAAAPAAALSSPAQPAPAPRAATAPPTASRVAPPVATARAASPAPIMPSASPPVAAASAADSRARREDGDAAAPSAPVAAATAASDNSAPAPITVPFADLPTFIATQAETLAASAPEAAKAPVAAAPTPKAPQAVKELQIALDPTDLGEMTLKLRLAGGKLTVTIAVANPQTLSAIEDDRKLIAARLGAGDQSLEDLVIQRQTQPATQETGSTHASPQDSDARNDEQRPDPGQARGGRQGGARRGSGDGGAFRDFL